MSAEPKVIYVPTCEQHEEHPIANMLLEHLAWPALGLVVFLILRSKIVELIDTAKKRLKEGKVSVTSEGVTLEAIQEGRQEIAREIFLLKMEGQQAQPPSSKTAEQQLQELSEQYLGRHANDLGVRTRAKDSLARRMGALVVQAGIDRDTLLDPKNPAKLAALAHASLLSPQAADVQRLLSACSMTKLKHVRYAIAMALARLIDDGILGQAAYFDVYRALADMQVGADASLQSRIQKTLGLLWAQ
jgi:hypothetical protein